MCECTMIIYEASSELNNLLVVFLLVAVVDESLHRCHVAVVNELLEVELVSLVSGDLPQGQEPRHQLGQDQHHHHAPRRDLCEKGF